MPKCERCGKDYELSKKDQMLRGAVTKLSGRVSSMLPGIDVQAQKAKNYCNDCWKHELNKTATPFLKATLQDIEASEKELSKRERGQQRER